jgi:hypothetical protein
MKNRAGGLEDGDRNSKSNFHIFKILRGFFKDNIILQAEKINLSHEGYAKLTTELNQGIDDTVTPLCILEVGRPGLVGPGVSRSFPFNLAPHEIYNFSE